MQIWSMDMWKQGRGGTNWEIKIIYSIYITHTYTAMSEIDSQWDPAVAEGAQLGAL